MLRSEYWLILIDTCYIHIPNFSSWWQFHNEIWSNQFFPAWHTYARTNIIPVRRECSFAAIHCYTLCAGAARGVCGNVVYAITYGLRVILDSIRKSHNIVLEGSERDLRDSPAAQGARLTCTRRDWCCTSNPAHKVTPQPQTYLPILR